jgi:hypothetical protein
MIQSPFTTMSPLFLPQFTPAVEIAREGDDSETLAVPTVSPSAGFGSTHNETHRPVSNTYCLPPFLTQLKALTESPGEGDSLVSLSARCFFE